MVQGEANELRNAGSVIYEQPQCCAQGRARLNFDTETCRRVPICRFNASCTHLS